MENYLTVQRDSERWSEPVAATGVKVFTQLVNRQRGKELIMRWSFWPVSITVHVAIGIAVLIAPLMAEVEPPPAAPLHSLIVATKTVPIPPEVVVPAPAVRSIQALPNVIAPLTLDKERETPDPPASPVIPDLPL